MLAIIITENEVCCFHACNYDQRKWGLFDDIGFGVDDNDAGNCDDVGHVDDNDDNGDDYNNNYDSDQYKLK